MLLVKLCKADGPGARSLLGLWKWLVLLRGLFLLQDLFLYAGRRVFNLTFHTWDNSLLSFKQHSWRWWSPPCSVSMINTLTSGLILSGLSPFSGYSCLQRRPDLDSLSCIFSDEEKPTPYACISPLTIHVDSQTTRLVVVIEQAQSWCRRAPHTPTVLILLRRSGQCGSMPLLYGSWADKLIVIQNRVLVPSAGKWSHRWYDAQSTYTPCWWIWSDVDISCKVGDERSRVTSVWM